MNNSNSNITLFNNYFLKGLFMFKYKNNEWKYEAITGL